MYYWYNAFLGKNRKDSCDFVRYLTRLKSSYSYLEPELHNFPILDPHNFLSQSWSQENDAAPAAISDHQI
jgi:hypothetical protein